VQTNPRIDRLTREVLGERKARDIAASVASIEVMVVAVAIVFAVAALFSIDPEVSPAPRAQVRAIEGFLEAGNSWPVPVKPEHEGAGKSDDSGS
jgi:hypothetical protein